MTKFSLDEDGSAAGSSTVQFLDMPDVTIPSHHKGLRGFLKQNMQQRKCILIFSRFIIFGQQLWIHISLWSVGKTLHCFCFTLTVGNLCECSMADRIIKSQKLVIPMVQIHGIQISLFFSKGFFLNIYMNSTCWDVCLAS